MIDLQRILSENEIDEDHLTTTVYLYINNAKFAAASVKHINSHKIVVYDRTKQYQPNKAFHYKAVENFLEMLTV